MTLKIICITSYLISLTPEKLIHLMDFYSLGMGDTWGHLKGAKKSLFSQDTQTLIGKLHYHINTQTPRCKRGNSLAEISSNQMICYE